MCGVSYSRWHLGEHDGTRCAFGLSLTRDSIADVAGNVDMLLGYVWIDDHGAMFIEGAEGYLCWRSRIACGVVNDRLEHGSYGRNASNLYHPWPSYQLILDDLLMNR